MYGFDSEDDSLSSAYSTLFLLAGLAVATLAIAKVAEASNRIKYESTFARIVAGLLLVMIRMMHSKSEDLALPKGKKLLAIGPHRTSLDALVVASTVKETPTRFLATDSFNKIPGMRRFLDMFKAIPVAANPTKSENGRSGNDSALELASQALRDNGCVALFPQGNFAKLDQEPPKVYPGAARLALESKMPIHVIRLDGFWSLENPLIPKGIRNNTYYRAFLSALHMNNVRATLCCDIDFHLQPENEKLSDIEKIEEICAQLYAYFRHTQELTPEKIESIKIEISNGTHRDIWKNKVEQDKLGKQLSTLKKEGAKTELSKHASLLIWNKNIDEQDALEKQLLDLKKEGTKLAEPTLSSMNLKPI